MSDRVALRTARIDAVLQEVHFIRQEILDNIGRLHRTVTSALGAFGAIVVLAFHQQDIAILLAGPWITAIFSFLWLGCQSHLDFSSLYLRDEIEKRKWPALIGCRKAKRGDRPHRRYWVSWQHAFDDKIPSVFEDWVVLASIWLLGVVTLGAGGTREPWDFPLGWRFVIGVSCVPLGVSAVCIGKQCFAGSHKRCREAKTPA